ncbi:MULTISPECIES: hypothetical protein [unclassified Curtobacterium]|uniref:hypothetical protein n=1 Tax=unclassified Curtobacterium TaxID=257496 RepID=UPI00380404C2
MTAAWQPIFPNGREQLVTEGFPAWLRTPLVPWFRSRLSPHSDYFPSDALTDFQLLTHTDWGFTSASISFGSQMMEFLETVGDETYINLMDFLLSWTPQPAGWGIDPKANELNEVLKKANSDWTAARVGDRFTLVKSVSAGVLRSVEQTLNRDSPAAVELQLAFTQAFGTHRSPSDAYSNAVVAVEIAALTVVKVNKQDATLGNVIGQLETQPDKWTLAFRDDHKAPGAETLAKMLRTLWKGHESRHGREDYKDATEQQAQAAVLLASTLVWWFSEGVVRPASAT